MKGFVFEYEWGGNGTGCIFVVAANLDDARVLVKAAAKDRFRGTLCAASERSVQEIQLDVPSCYDFWAYED